PAQSDILFFELAKKTEQELKEKLYSVLRSKAEINDLSKKLITKYLEQEEKFQQSQTALSILPLDFVKEGRENLVNELRPYSKVRLCEKADTPPPPGLIIVILPKLFIMPPQCYPTQNLDKEHLIPIINAEIEETDM
ncbi:15240_t:CDS:2, partial [Gigaspora margarita]